MKRTSLFIFILFIIAMLFIANTSEAVFDSGSTGADGPFNPSTNTELQVPANGIFNFTTVNIPAGVTVTFIKNAANTPVYMLATGDVTIAGIINISGGDGLASNGPPGSGGPGGYNGGFVGVTQSPGGNGLGPGGGAGSPTIVGNAGGGGFGTQGGTGSGGGVGGPAYGNARIVPFIGGSGGGGAGGSVYPNGAGGGGGGAILIASSGSIALSGSILSNGGNSNGPCGWTYTGGGGSGGAIKLMANSISGYGNITAQGGAIGCTNYGGKGLIRLEAYTNNFNGGSDPAYSYGQPSNVFPANLPTLNITSIGGTNVPASPTGSYAQPDITLPSTTTNPVTVNVAATYIPVGTQVTVNSIPQYGVQNNNTTLLSGTLQSSTGSTTVNLSTQYSNVVTAEATYVLQQAMYWDGEKIEKVKVAAVMGKESEVIYITESGKEIKAKDMIGKL